MAGKVIDKNIKALLIGVAILGGAVGLYFATSFLVEKMKKGKTDERKDKLKEESGTGESNEAQQVEEEAVKKYNPSSDVKSLEAQIVGINTYCRTKEVNNIVMTLTDAELKKLNSAWKTKYKMSLYRYLDEEHDNAWFFENCYPAAMKRLSNLGLR